MRAAQFRKTQARDMSESVFQSKVISMAKSLGWEHYHTHDSRRSVAGFPDLVLVHPQKGWIIYRELKTETGRVSQAQWHWISMLRACRQDVDVWRPSGLLDGSILRDLSAGLGAKGKSE